MDVSSASAAALAALHSTLPPPPTFALSGATLDASGDALDALGRDLFTFLSASVVVVPLSRSLGVTPVLGFLAIGCLIGPHGLALLRESGADLELGDFGILFLLFNEGLNLRPDRLKDLGRFFKLGLAQGLLTVGVFFFFSFYLGPLLLPLVETVAPSLDGELLYAIRATPVAAFCVAAAGSLSSSAFVLPVPGWHRTDRVFPV